MHALSELGMTSEAVMTGEAAVEKVAAAHEAARDYNVCLIDWKLPGMDGIETTRAVRACVGPDVPIIIISAYDWSSIEKEAREAGADGFIEKPLFKSRLDVVLSSLVQGKSDKAAAVEFEDLEKLDFSGRRVLLVEDNPLNQEIATEMLKMTKVEIETAANGQEAVTAFETHRPGWYDLILMDIQMPVLDGNAAARRIRASAQADACTVPVVAMSANAFAEDRSSARKAGMNDYLTKPVHYGELVRMMSRYLG